MSKRFGLWIVLGALVACPAMGYADDGMAGGKPKITLSLTSDYTASPWTNEAGYTNRVVGKLGFGIKNLLLGWTDLITEPRDAMAEGGNFFTGLGYGLKDALENELGGVVHLVTFPITAVDAPLPEGGVDLL